MATADMLALIITAEVDLYDNHYNFPRACKDLGSEGVTA